MQSVADRLREEDRAEILAMTPAERVALALALGARDRETFRNAADPRVSAEEAQHILERQRQRGRRRSRCIEDLIG